MMATTQRKTISRDTAKRQLEYLRQTQTVETARASEPSSVDLAYRKAAAVLSSFHPRTLLPFDLPDAQPGDAYLHVLPVSEPQARDGGIAQWRLKQSARRRALEALGTRDAMIDALAANPKRPHDPVQHALETLIRGKTVELSELDAAAIAGFLAAADWLRPVLDDIPDRNMLLGLSARAKLLHPLRELVGDGFVGREDTLRRLRGYVGTLPSRGLLESIQRLGTDLYYSLAERPPFFIYGPGGIGKSTLIAKFLIDHVDFDSQQQLPFAYLNFDRPTLSADRPLTLLVEAAFQIGVQFPDAKQAADEVTGGILRALASEDPDEASKSLLPRHELIEEFAGFLERAMPPDVPILLALDTFEEVQFLGDDIVLGIWTFLDDLQRAIPRLRVIIAGRALAKQFPADEEPLGDLDPELARFFVESVLRKLGEEEPSREVLRQIVSIAGSNPLCLRLAARLFVGEGVKGLNEVKTRNRFGLRLSAEIVQARLYGRILSHLHDNRLRQLAHPGLILRRITPELIRVVLAKPCGLDLAPGEERELFEALSREVALVERDPDGSLRHRLDVRRVMLKEIEAEKGEAARRIDRAAVKFYSDQAGMVARAEEVYHRLRLDQKPSTIEGRWQTGVEDLLKTALDEVPPSARVYLAGKLDTTIDDGLVRNADLDLWEKMTLRSVRRLLASGLADNALSALQERSERSAASPLYPLEVEVLRALGRDEAALELTHRAIDAATQAEDHRLVAELLRHRSLIHERKGAHSQALSDARDAAQILELSEDRVAYWRMTIAELRLLRKIGKEEQRETLARAAVERVTPELLRDLRKHAVLLRETTAELGSYDIALFQAAIETLGLDVTSDRQVEQVADLLNNWNAETEAADSPGTLGDYARIRGNAPDTSAWAQWVDDNKGRNLDRLVRRSLRRFDVAAETREALAENFRTTVDDSIVGRYDNMS